VTAASHECPTGGTDKLMRWCVCPLGDPWPDTPQSPLSCRSLRKLRLVQPARFEWMPSSRFYFDRPERLCPWHQPPINWIPTCVRKANARNEWDFKPDDALGRPTGARVNYMSFWKRPGISGTRRGCSGTAPVDSAWVFDRNAQPFPVHRSITKLPLALHGRASARPG
jgi:hypothetical protein